MKNGFDVDEEKRKRNKNLTSRFLAPNLLVRFFSFAHSLSLAPSFSSIAHIGASKLDPLQQREIGEREREKERKDCV